MLLSALESIGDGIEKSSGGHALAFVVDDDGGGRVGVVAVSVEADLDFLVAQIDGRFVAMAVEAEGVVFFDLPCCFRVEEFVVVFGGREEADAGERSMPKRSMGFMPMASWLVAL